MTCGCRVQAQVNVVIDLVAIEAKYQLIAIKIFLICCVRENSANVCITKALDQLWAV